MARVVIVAGVEQCDAAVERFVDGGDAFALVGGAVHAGHPHAAEGQREDLGASAKPAAVRAVLWHHGSKLDSPGIRWEEGSRKCHTHLEEAITPAAHWAGAPQSYFLGGRKRVCPFIVMASLRRQNDGIVADRTRNFSN